MKTLKTRCAQLVKVDDVDYEKYKDKSLGFNPNTVGVFFSETRKDHTGNWRVKHFQLKREIMCNPLNENKKRATIFYLDRDPLNLQKHNLSLVKQKTKPKPFKAPLREKTATEPAYGDVKVFSADGKLKKTIKAEDIYKRQFVDSFNEGFRTDMTMMTQYNKESRGDYIDTTTRIAMSKLDSRGPQYSYHDSKRELTPVLDD